MRYIIADKVRAIDAGIALKGHREKNAFILLNEKEVANLPALAAYPTLEEKCERILGTIYTHEQIIHQLEQEDWNNA